MTEHTTAIFILGFLALIFGYDTLAVAFGWHASISECVTNGLHQSTLFTGIFSFGLGAVLSHWFFSVDYNKKDN